MQKWKFLNVGPKMPYLDSFGPELGDVKHLRVCLIANLGAEIAAICVSGDTHARFKNRYTLWVVELFAENEHDDCTLFQLFRVFNPILDDVI